MRKITFIGLTIIMFFFKSTAIANYEKVFYDFEIEKLSLSSACLNKSLTKSNLSYNSFPIPTIWEPWPGKITENI